MRNPSRVHSCTCVGVQPLHAFSWSNLKERDVSYHNYANDTQTCLDLSPSDFGPIELLCQCLERVHNRMHQNLLQVNKYKMEIILFGNKEGISICCAHMESSALRTSTHVKSLGVIMDADLILVIKAARLKTLLKLETLCSETFPCINFLQSCYCNALFTGIP